MVRHSYQKYVIRTKVWAITISAKMQYMIGYAYECAVFDIGIAHTWFLIILFTFRKKALRFLNLSSFLDSEQQEGKQALFNEE